MYIENKTSPGWEMTIRQLLTVEILQCLECQTQCYADSLVDRLTFVCRGVVFLYGNLGGLVAKVVRDRFSRHAVGTELFMAM